MKSVRRYFFEEKPLNFKSLMIVSYGRSGSTLLQGILNKIDGMVIRGENFNMCFHLFQTYKSILLSKDHKGRLSQSPFYGAELLDTKYFLKQTKETVRGLLLANQRSKASIKCYGFKEIRYWENLEVFSEFLDFLKLIFPDVCFIFNTRKKEDVAKSWIKTKLHEIEEESQVLQILDNAEAAFFDYMQKNKKITFHITYEDIIGQRKNLESLFTFLGADYSQKKIEKVLSFRHSYSPNQKHIEDLPYYRN